MQSYSIMKTILVIEDEKNIRNRIIDTLELANEPYTVFAAENGREGVNIALCEVPDLIISDVMMPEMDGYEVLKVLRSTPATMTIPFIFLSAKADIAHIREGMNLGADDYLPKPFSIDELLKTVSLRLAKQATQVQQTQQEIEHELDGVRLRIAGSLPHEFRTPLSALIGFTDLLRGYKNLDEETIFMMLDQVRSNADRLQRLVENFLLYSHIEMAMLRHTAEQAFPNDSLGLASEIVRETAHSTAVRYGRESDLHCTADSAVVTITGQYLRKIVEELTDNACKFSSKQSPITFEARNEGAMYRLTVIDHGRGMSETEIARIGAYMQFEREIYEQQGVGLGLAIVQRLVQAYHGSLALTNTGTGTEAVALLPIVSG
jgi:two-component system, sensor histidine kinase and response regulator